MKISKKLEPYLSLISQDFSITNKGTLSALETYKQEKIFQSLIHEKYKDEKTIMDFESLNPRYGKSSLDSMAMYPKFGQLLTVGEDVSVLNFVADAYNNFINQLEILKQKKIISKESPVYNFEAKNGILNIDEIYYEYINKLYASFFDFLNFFSYKDKIKNFDHFIEAFVQFVEARTPDFVFNKSSFIQSKYCSRMSSGLFINLLDNNINDDQYKIENLYESPYFNCFTEDVFNDVYINLVKESGFYINKDIPWQIVANLRSPKIKFYFYKRLESILPPDQLPFQVVSSAYEEIIQDLENFDLESYLFSNNQISFYNNANYQDINNLKIILARMYNQYCLTVETVVETKVVKEQGDFKVKTISTDLQMVDEEILIEEEPDYMWIKLYTFIKGRENSATWNQAKFDDINKKFASIQRGLDISSAIRYLQSEIAADRKNAKQKNFFF